MAKSTSKKLDKEYVSDQWEFEYRKDFEQDFDTHRHVIQGYDALEAMLIGQVYDTVSNSIDGSKITDSYATTLAIERSARVMGKLPDGYTEAVAKSEAGIGAFFDVLRQKWIYPNANAQYPFKLKLRLWDLYSTVYGWMPMHYDINSNHQGYVGPDCWRWSPRKLVPQDGRISINDSDYVTALTTVNDQFIEKILKSDNDKDGWNRKALKEMYEISKQRRQQVDTTEDSEVVRNRTPNRSKEGIKLATRYEAGQGGEWIVFAPELGFQEVRRLPNPHKNGRIPFVIKYSQPLFDTWYGMGDMQRAKPIQFARDGLTNFYFKGIKMNLIPPIVANANTVMKHTLDLRDGAVMLETQPNSIRRLETSTAGLATYQAATTALTGSLLALYGTQNAAIPGQEALNPNQGKTPAAIRMYNDKEANRDGQDRELLEMAIEELTDGFFSIIANVSTEEIPVKLFAEDIKEIYDRGMQDVLGLFTNRFKESTDIVAGELKIDPKKLRNVEARFHINPGSTAQVNREAQRESLENMIAVLAKYQNVLQDDPRVEIEWGELLATYEKLSDIDGVKNFIRVNDGPTKNEQMLIAKIEELQGQMQQMMQQAQAQQAQAQTRLTPATYNVGGAQFQNPDIAQMAGEFTQ